MIAMNEHPASKGNSGSPVFQKALKEGAIDSIRRTNKTDFHNHSVFGTRMSNIQKWVGHHIVRPPLQMQSLEDLHRYSREYLHPHIFNRQGFEFTTESSIADAIWDGVIILEMSVDVGWILAYDEREQFFEYVLRLINKHKNQLDFRPEIGIMRNGDPTVQIPLAEEFARSGLFRSIDLYGTEDAQAPEIYQDLYNHVKKQNIKLKAHVGEFGDAKDVATTIDILQLDEIQHGISAATSTELMRRIRDRNIRLNICPTSNVVLGRVAQLAHHPIRKLFDNGVRVSINSDDLAIFDQSVSEEFLNLYKSGVLTASELDSIRIDALNS
jgi:adenosine deaminase